MSRYTQACTASADFGRRLLLENMARIISDLGNPLNVSSAAVGTVLPGSGQDGRNTGRRRGRRVTEHGTLQVPWGPGGAWERRSALWPCGTLPPAQALLVEALVEGDDAHHRVLRNCGMAAVDQQTAVVEVIAG